MPTEAELIILGLALLKMGAWIVPTFIGGWIANEAVEFFKPWRF